LRPLEQQVVANKASFVRLIIRLLQRKFIGRLHRRIELELQIPHVKVTSTCQGHIKSV